MKQQSSPRGAYQRGFPDFSAACYAPESNPDEYLNSDVKTNLRLGPVSENRGQMIEKAMSFMTRLSSWPERVRAYFQHPSAKYAAQPI